MKLTLPLLMLLSFAICDSSFAEKQKQVRTSTAQGVTPNGVSQYQLLEDESESNPRLWFGVNTAPLGVGLAVGAPIIPIDLGVRIFDRLSVGPTATFSGSFHHDDADFKLSGFGVQAMYNFGHLAISDGFYLVGFFQHYNLSATKMQSYDIGNGQSFAVPMEGSMPLNSVGGGLGYQWVWKNGMRLAAGVRVAYIASDASEINAMSKEVNSMGDAFAGSGFGGSAGSTAIKVPYIEDRSVIVPMPELSLGWSI